MNLCQAETVVQDHAEENNAMTHPADPSLREPKGDHNRRVALGMSPDAFAAHAGITLDQLREYEMTAPGKDFDLVTAMAVGSALERLEANPPPSQKVVT
jgi:hypothetical protein